MSISDGRRATARIETSAAGARWIYWEQNRCDSPSVKDPEVWAFSNVPWTNIVPLDSKLEMGSRASDQINDRSVSKDAVNEAATGDRIVWLGT